MSALAARDAYRLWAANYEAETAVSFLDAELAKALSPRTEGKMLLDAGCGTGRRMPRDAQFAAGVDACVEMLNAGGRDDVAAADIRALPFPGGQFDIVWCRLVLGHVLELPPAYRELARVCRIGGHLLVTDFHADAVAAGHKRSFRDSSGRAHEVVHYERDHAAHEAAAAMAGFSLAARRDARIGPEVEHFFANAGRTQQFARDRGLAVVCGLLFQRSSCAS